jgi:uncharacterized protein HemX
MSYENFPESNTPVEKTVVKNNNSRNILTSILVIALLGTWGYIIFDKSKTRQEKDNLTTQIITSDSAKNELQRELDDAAMRLDALKTSNVKADSLLQTKDKDIQALKSKVQAILNDKKCFSRTAFRSEKIDRPIKRKH